MTSGSTVELRLAVSVKWRLCCGMKQLACLFVRVCVSEFDLRSFLCSESEQLIWKSQGLPSDDLSMENALVILQVRLNCLVKSLSYTFIIHFLSHLSPLLILLVFVRLNSIKNVWNLKSTCNKQTVIHNTHEAFPYNDQSPFFTVVLRKLPLSPFIRPASVCILFVCFFLPLLTSDQCTQVAGKTLFHSLSLV